MLKSLVLGTALVLSLAACATAPVSPDKATAAANAKPPAGCVGQSATLIRQKDPSKCVGFGSVYTRDDIDRTGQVSDIGRALQMLDPSINSR